jgi:hypothetical protein
MAKGEVRKGKWGILGDGFFAQLSASGDTPGPLYNNANIKLQQGMAQLALAYRIIDDRRGYLDVYAGASYNCLGLTINGRQDRSGIQDVGNSLAGNIVSQVQQRAYAIIAQNTAILQSDLQNQITQGVTTRLLEDWASAPHSVSDFLSDRELSNVFRHVDPQFRDFTAAVAAADIAAAKNGDHYPPPPDSPRAPHLFQRERRGVKKPCDPGSVFIKAGEAPIKQIGAQLLFEPSLLPHPARCFGGDSRYRAIFSRRRLISSV